MINLDFFKSQLWLLGLQKHQEEVIQEVADRAISAESKLAELEKQEPHHYLHLGKTVAYPNPIYVNDKEWIPYYAQPKPVQVSEPVAQRITEQDAREIWVHGYEAGHHEGIGCGHSLAPRCRHKGEDEFYADDLSDLLAKLNEHREPDYKKLAEEELIAQDACHDYGWMGGWSAALRGDTKAMEEVKSRRAKRAVIAQCEVKNNPDAWMSKEDAEKLLQFGGNFITGGKVSEDDVPVFVGNVTANKAEVPSDIVYCKTCNDSGEIAVGVAHTESDSVEIACPDCSYAHALPPLKDGAQ